MPTFADKIIILDDNLSTHDYSTAFFKNYSYEVKNFYTAKSALQYFSQNLNKNDILITDYHFTDMPKETFKSILNNYNSDISTLELTTTDIGNTNILINRLEDGVKIDRAIHFKEIVQNIEFILNKPKTIKQETTIDNKNCIDDFFSNLSDYSPLFLKTLELASKSAKSFASILIIGESGTGKEVLANHIHFLSKRKGKMIAINCTSIPENLLESELFGHAKGSFTGAIDKKIGLFEVAKDGTIFLDEIGDLSLPLQAKLLRVLQEKKIRRVGENIDIPINCRVITATHKNLIKEVNQGRFREDLYFRINVIQIKIPPLRDRKEDILPLANMFLKKISLENGLEENKFFTKNAMDWLSNNPWRGNVRELENKIERAIVLSTSSKISLEDFKSDLIEDLGQKDNLNNKQDNKLSLDNAFIIQFNGILPTLEYIKNEYISYAIKINHGAKDKTARDIGIDRKTLYKREVQYTNGKVADNLHTKI